MPRTPHPYNIFKAIEHWNKTNSVSSSTSTPITKKRVQQPQKQDQQQQAQNTTLTVTNQPHSITTGKSVSGGIGTQILSSSSLNALISPLSSVDTQTEEHTRTVHTQTDSIISSTTLPQNQQQIDAPHDENAIELNPVELPPPAELEVDPFELAIPVELPAKPAQPARLDAERLAQYLIHKNLAST